MYDPSMFGMANFPAWFGAALPLILLWSLFWKGLALWHSARRRQPIWFVVLLFVNTIGILEIVYLFFIAKIKLHELFSAKTGEGERAM